MNNKFCYCYFCQAMCWADKMVGALCDKCWIEYLNELKKPPLKRSRNFRQWKYEDCLKTKPQVYDYKEYLKQLKQQEQEEKINAIDKESYIKYLKKYHNDIHLESVLKVVENTEEACFKKTIGVKNG